MKFGGRGLRQLEVTLIGPSKDESSLVSEAQSINRPVLMLDDDIHHRPQIGIRFYILVINPLLAILAMMDLLSDCC